MKKRAYGSALGIYDQQIFEAKSYYCIKPWKNTTAYAENNVQKLVSVRTQVT